MLFDFLSSDMSSQESLSSVEQFSVTENSVSPLETSGLDLNNSALAVHDIHLQSIEDNGLVTDVPLLQPYDHSQTTNLIHRVTDPLGQYVASNTNHGFIGTPEPELVHHLTIPDNFTHSDIQCVCNAICDTVHWPHIPVNLTTSVPNAAFTPGLFTHRTFDDHLYLNPDYAHQSIAETGSTDIIIADMAHEIGHSMAFKLCGDLGTFLNEKLADTISGYVCGKMGVDIEVARRWFEQHYDSEGYGGYPVSDERWEAEMAGYYLSHITNADDLRSALQDQKFIDLIAAYHHDTNQLAHSLGYSSVSEASAANNDFYSQMLDELRHAASRYHLPQIAARIARNIRF